MNVQDAYDPKCRFVHADLAAPGGANDIVVLRKTKFIQVVQKLRLRKFVIGGNSNACSGTLLTPFSGVENDEPEKDAFDFYLSQLMIHIEQIFGFMTAK